MEVYQYANGDYLSETSQPSEDSINFEIKAKKYTPHKSVRYINVVIGKNGIAKKKGLDGTLMDMDKQLPTLYKKREDCCGCTACFAVCPMEAIDMKPDEEGFLYPVIDAQKCIRCYKCLFVCTFKKTSNPIDVM